MSCASASGSIVTLTQADLARRVGRRRAATISSYESLTAPKTPTTARLNTYAQFFATRRSMDEKPPRLREITTFAPDERERFEQLKDELFALHAAIEKDLPPPPARRSGEPCCRSTARTASSSSARRRPPIPGARSRTRRVSTTPGCTGSPTPTRCSRSSGTSAR